MSELILPDDFFENDNHPAELTLPDDFFENATAELTLPDDFFGDDNHPIVSRYTRKKQPDTTMLYIVLSSQTGMIKIGITRDIIKRLSALTGSHGYKLTILYHFTSPDAIVYEKMLHRYWKKCRQEGEWFKPDISAQKFTNISKRLVAKKQKLIGD